nr:restriction endonuclease subunit S [uncultured Flavobacterium sp.]
MREGWKEVTIEKISSKLGDGLHGTPKYDDNGEYYFINGNNLQNGKIIIKAETKKISFFEYNKIKKQLNDRTLLVAINGTIGNVGLYAGEKVALGKSACYFNVIDSVEKDYIRYVLESSAFQNYAQLFATGATIKNLSLKAVRSFSFYLPPLQTQRKIASILSSYDDLIENNLKRIKLLEEKAQRTYEEWFVKMRFPGYETAVFDQVTGLPEGWEKKTIGEICKVSGGGTPSRTLEEYWNNGDITWYSPTDLSKANSLCVLDSSQKITELGLKKSSAKLLNENSFMMTSRATIGLFALVNHPFTTNQGFINVTPINEFEKEYLLYNFKYRVEEFKGHATGATFPELSKSKFNALDIIWPSETSLKQFNKITSILHIQLFNLTNQNRLLKEARDILLPRLMSGMIDVEDMEITVMD